MAYVKPRGFTRRVGEPAGEQVAQRRGRDAHCGRSPHGSPARRAGDPGADR